MGILSAGQHPPRAPAPGCGSPSLPRPAPPRRTATRTARHRAARPAAWPGTRRPLPRPPGTPCPASPAPARTAMTSRAARAGRAAVLLAAAVTSAITAAAKKAHSSQAAPASTVTAVPPLSGLAASSRACCQPGQCPGSGGPASRLSPQGRPASRTAAPVTSAAARSRLTGATALAARCWPGCAARGRRARWGQRGRRWPLRPAAGRLPAASRVPARAAPALPGRCPRGRRSRRHRPSPARRDHCEADPPGRGRGGDPRRRISRQVKLGHHLCCRAGPRGGGDP